MWYVTMTDNFMSGWGHAKGKKNVLILICESEREVRAVVNYAHTREEMSDIEIWDKDPNYENAAYYVQYKTKEQMPIFYKGV